MKTAKSYYIRALNFLNSLIISYAKRLKMLLYRNFWLFSLQNRNHKEISFTKNSSLRNIRWWQIYAQNIHYTKYLVIKMPKGICLQSSNISPSRGAPIDMRLGGPWRNLTNWAKYDQLSWWSENTWPTVIYCLFCPNW